MIIAHFNAFLQHFGPNLHIKTGFQCPKHIFQFGLTYIKGFVQKKISESAIITLNNFANGFDTEMCPHSIIPSVS